jgi:hypothetical protein
MNTTGRKRRARYHHTVATEPSFQMRNLLPQAKSFRRRRCTTLAPFVMRVLKIEGDKDKHTEQHGES